MTIGLGPLIAVALAAVQASQPARGTIVEHLTCPGDPAQTYTLYLPSTYQPARTWPLLLVFDPGGRAARATEVFRDAAERFGWIVATSENSRNGPWEPTLRAVNAMWPALLGGYAVDERRVYAAGHSGGATVAWMLARQTGQIAGVIVSGQPNPESRDTKGKPFAWFGMAGHVDFNFMEVKKIDQDFAKTTTPHRVEFFDGGHQWPPPDLIARAFGWMEIVAMKDGRRLRDQDLARTLLGEDMARARALEERGLLTEAWRSYGTIASSYSGVIDVSEAERRHQSLENDDRFKTAQKIEERADRRERDQAVALGRVLTRLTADDMPLAAELRNRLNVDALVKASRGEGYEAQSASRSLSLLRIQLSTIAREMREQHDARADVVQKVLDSIK